MGGISDSIYYHAFLHPEMNAVKIIPENNQSHSLIKFQSDTIHYIESTFLPGRHTEIIQKLNPAAFQDWMIWGLLLLAFALAVFWFYMPVQIMSVFSISGKKKYFRKIRQATDYEPGILIKLFFVLTYWFTISLFIFLTVDNFIPDLVAHFKLNPRLQVLYITGAIAILFLFRYVFIMVTGFIFNTTDMAFQQLRLYLNTDYATGVILIPLLLLILLVNVEFLFYVALFIVVMIYVFRWLISYKISKSNSGFSSLHLFMYLCTLEMIPFLLLLKVLELRFI
ncbi:MAG: DUF4271 domain-containing protein [Chlorobi bacterium]|nr:DUF4271 domain-containing protein [Chlorobiota bacterium]